MPQNVHKRSRVVLACSLILGLLGLVWYLLNFRNKPPQVIARVLRSEGMSDRMVKYWTAVSAYETNGWSSRVFRDSDNLFNLIVPKSNRLPYGEGQTIFESRELAAKGLFMHVIKPFRYPLEVSSLDELTEVMKQKGYYEISQGDYLRGVTAWYKKLYGDE